MKKIFTQSPKTVPKLSQNKTFCEQSIIKMGQNVGISIDQTNIDSSTDFDEESEFDIIFIF